MSDRTLCCTCCGVTAEPAMVKGMLTDPPGWGNVTITGLPIVNRLLCPQCMNRVRAYLTTLTQTERPEQGAAA